MFRSVVHDHSVHPPGFMPGVMRMLQGAAVQRWLQTATLLLPLLVLVTVWMPEIAHYYVVTPTVSDELVAASRETPSAAVLEELDVSSLVLGLDYMHNDAHAIKLAKGVLSGTLALPDFPAISISPSFSSDDLSKGPPTLGLHVASLVVPDILLAAYQATGEPRYFHAARLYLVEFSQTERETWLSAGFLWNDHAIAARVFVLSRFWHRYRSHASYDTRTAKILLQAIARKAEFLAKPGHFTFATNHGVMQNLALLHLCVAFPELPGASRYQQLAIARLTDQLGFYVSPEGVVLEHSAAYHEVGVVLLGEIFRRMSMLNVPVPAEWREKYTKAIDFLTQIKRPDGTLPRFGNTAGEAEETQVATFTPHGHVSSFTTHDFQSIPRAHHDAPVSGYAVWWAGLDEWPQRQGLNQTVINWSYYQGHGHKHADEMNVLLWVDGQDWWTNVGYWPYGHELYDKAQSWEGSNAPHLIDETKNSVRSTEVLYQGYSDDLSFMELQRTGADAYRARRQIMQVLRDTWLIIDEVNDAEDRKSRVIWTANLDVTVVETDMPNSYRLRGSRSSTALDLQVLGSEGVNVDRARGGLTPFAGWVAEFDEIHEAPAFVVEMPARSWTASVWRLQPPGAPQDAETSSTMTRWRNSADWQMVLRLPQGPITLHRDHDRLMVDLAGSDHRVLALTHGADVGQQVEALHRHFATADQKYETFRDLQYYREKVSYALLMLLVLQEGFLLALQRIWRESVVIQSTLRGLALVIWGVVGVWLPLIYFSV